MELRISWYDPTFDTPEWHRKNMQGSEIKVTSYCCPKIEIEDVIEGDRGWADHKNVSEVHLGRLKVTDNLAPRGTVFKMIEVTSTIRLDIQIAEFPFDKHDIRVKLSMPESGYNAADMAQSCDHARYFLIHRVSVVAPHDHTI